jgi:hypothetical protein
MPSTVLKSKNKAAIGTKRIEEPKPDIVPNTSEIKPSTKKR